MKQKKFCSFPVRVTKAYIDSETGLKTIEAIASDTGLDYYEERFSTKSIDDMVYASRQKKELKPEEGLVGLQESHWEVFEIGFAVDAEKVEDAENGLQEYKVKLALKDNWKADELYEDVKNGRIDKQLSVGGVIPDWDNDYEVVDEVFTNKDNEEVTIQVGVIKRFELEHIAVTSPNGAANPRARFETAKSKDLGFENGSIYKSANSEAYQARFNKAKPVNEDNEKNLKSMINEFTKVVKEVVTEVFGERKEVEVKNVEKAKKMLEDFKKFIEDNSEELNEEVVKGLGINFVSEEDEDTPEIAEVIKAKLDEYTIELDEKLKAITESIPEVPEAPEIPEDNSEKVKALEDLVAAMDVRLKAIEDETPESQVEVETVVEEEEEVIEEEETEDSHPENAPWR